MEETSRHLPLRLPMTDLGVLCRHEGSSSWNALRRVSLLCAVTMLAGAGVAKLAWPPPPATFLGTRPGLRVAAALAEVLLAAGLVHAQSRAIAARAATLLMLILAGFLYVRLGSAGVPCGCLGHLVVTDLWVNLALIGANLVCLSLLVMPSRGGS